MICQRREHKSRTSYFEIIRRGANAHTEEEGREACGHLFLSLDDVGQLRVWDPGVEFTLHESGPLVVLDVTKVTSLGHFYVFGKTLRRPKKKSGERDKMVDRWGMFKKVYQSVLHGTCFLK